MQAQEEKSVGGKSARCQEQGQAVEVLPVFLRLQYFHMRAGIHSNTFAVAQHANSSRPTMRGSDSHTYRNCDEGVVIERDQRDQQGKKPHAGIRILRYEARTQRDSPDDGPRSC